MTILVISGIRDPLPESLPAIEKVVRQEADNATEVRLGGAIGVDTIALIALRHRDLARVVYVPFRLQDQPMAAQRAITAYATRVVELQLPRLQRSYLTRTERMLDGADRLLAITDGRTTGGTAFAQRHAKRCGLACRQFLCHGRGGPPPQADLFET